MFLMLLTIANLQQTESNPMKAIIMSGNTTFPKDLMPLTRTRKMDDQSISRNITSWNFTDPIPLDGNLFSTFVLK